MIIKYLLIYFLLGRITILRMQMRPAVTDTVACSVSPAKTTEPIKVPLGLWTQMGQGTTH